jgi:hypothetical protein
MGAWPTGGCQPNVTTEVNPGVAERLRALRLLAEVLLIGVLVCVSALPVVPALAACAAGATLLRELVAGDRTPSVRRYLVLLGAALREPVAALAPTGLVVVGGLDLLAVLGGLPGGRAFGVLLAAVLAGLAVTGVRAAAGWRPESAWRDVLRAAAADTMRDWPGSLMIVATLAVLVLVVGQAPGFVVIAPGLLVLAAVAVTRCRAAARH